MTCNITLLANRVLELAPLAGQPLPCRVRFRLTPGQGGTVVLLLTDVSPAGAAWQAGMWPVLQQWCQRYLGVSLAEGGPGEGKRKGVMPTTHLRA